MALVLSMKVGEQMRIGDQIFKLGDIEGEGEVFTLESGSDAWKITSDRAMEVAPDVLVSAGWDDDRPCARVVIRAPREIVIERLNR